MAFYKFKVQSIRTQYLNKKSCQIGFIRLCLREFRKIGLVVLTCFLSLFHFEMASADILIEFSGGNHKDGAYLFADTREGVNGPDSEYITPKPLKHLEVSLRTEYGGVIAESHLARILVMLATIDKELDHQIEFEINGMLEVLTWLVKNIETLEARAYLDFFLAKINNINGSTNESRINPWSPEHRIHQLDELLEFIRYNGSKLNIKEAYDQNSPSTLQLVKALKDALHNAIPNVPMGDNQSLAEGTYVEPIGGQPSRETKYYYTVRTGPEPNRFIDSATSDPLFVFHLAFNNFGSRSLTSAMMEYVDDVRISNAILVQKSLPPDWNLTNHNRRSGTTTLQNLCNQVLNAQNSELNFFKKLF